MVVTVDMYLSIRIDNDIQSLVNGVLHSIISQAKVSSYGFPNETSRLNEQVRRTARITEPVTVCQRMLR